MIQIISLQRTGGSSLYMCLLQTYIGEWQPSGYEPVNLIERWYKDNQSITIEALKEISEEINNNNNNIIQDIKQCGNNIRLMPIDFKQDKSLLLNYLNKLSKKLNIAQKTLSLVNLTEDFISLGMTPIFCSRYLDQYLSSYIKLGINPHVILKEDPGILNNKHEKTLQCIINEMRRQPIFSYEMGVIDQFPSCCRWIIHSYYSIKYNLEKNIPIIWTGDNSTKNKKLCEYIRKDLGKENGKNGFLEDNLLKKTFPSSATDFINIPNSWNFWPNDKIRDTQNVNSYVKCIASILNKIESPIVKEMSKRLYFYCEER